MQFFAVLLGVASVVALPLSKTNSQECCVVDPLKPAADGCRCFGSFKPSGEHQQCMSSAPQFTSDRLSRAWQAGCWCIDETQFCQDFCNNETPVNAAVPIRVLKVDKDSGENSWVSTTVGAAVAQPVDVTDTEARTQCFNGCESRGFCRTEIAKAWPKLVTPLCPPLPALRMAIYKGDSRSQGTALSLTRSKCRAGGVLEYGEKCFIEATDGNWCKTNTIACEAASEEADFLVLSVEEGQVCFPVTQDPTHAPSAKPTKQPTFEPTPEPTPSPTMQPVDNPTVMGCNKHNNLPTDCSADTAEFCSYSATSATCEACATWNGNDVCKTSTMCGLSTSNGQCTYCTTHADDTSCTEATGCQWTGSACIGTN